MIKITNTVKKFKEMFNMIICGNRYPLFPDFNLHINDNVINVGVHDPSNTATSNQTYNGFKIVGNGNLSLNNSIMDVIKLFNNDEIIDLTYNSDNSRIEISSNNESSKNTITIPILETEESQKIEIDFSDKYISLGGKSHEYVGIVENIDCEYFHNQIKKASLNEYSANNIEINDGVTLSVGDISKFEISASTEIKIDTIGNVNSQYMGAYTDIFKTLNGEVSIKMTEMGLLVISQETEDYTVNYLLAPALI